MRIWLVLFPMLLIFILIITNAFSVKHIEYHKSLYKDGFKKSRRYVISKIFDTSLKTFPVNFPSFFFFKFSLFLLPFASWFLSSHILLSTKMLNQVLDHNKVVIRNYYVKNFNQNFSSKSKLLVHIFILHYHNFITFYYEKQIISNIQHSWKMFTVSNHISIC